MCKRCSVITQMSFKGTRFMLKASGGILRGESQRAFCLGLIRSFRCDCLVLSLSMVTWASSGETPRGDHLRFLRAAAGFTSCAPRYAPKLIPTTSRTTKRI